VKLNVLVLSLILSVTASIADTGNKNELQIQIPGHWVWSELSYQASKWPAEAQVDFSSERVSAMNMPTKYVVSPQGIPVSPKKNDVLLLRAKVNLKLPLQSADDQFFDVWYDPDDGAALMRVHWRRGGRPKWNAYRFTDTGVFRIKRKPGSHDDVVHLPSEWREEARSYYSYQGGQHDCNRVSDPVALFYLLASKSVLSSSKTTDICVFGEKHLHHVSVKQSKSRRVAANFRLAIDGNEWRQQGEYDVTEWTLRAVESDGDSVEPFSLLGLQGDIRFQVDPVSHLPLMFSGSISGFGQVVFQLTRACGFSLDSAKVSDLSP